MRFNLRHKDRQEARYVQQRLRSFVPSAKDTEARIALLKHGVVGVDDALADEKTLANCGDAGQITEDRLRLGDFGLGHLLRRAGDIDVLRQRRRRRAFKRETAASAEA